MTEALARAREWLSHLVGHDQRIDRLERAAVTLTRDSRAVERRLAEISRNRDPLAELVRNVKSASFRPH